MQNCRYGRNGWLFPPCFVQIPRFSCRLVVVSPAIVIQDFKSEISLQAVLTDHLKFSVVGDFSCQSYCPGIFPNIIFRLRATVPPASILFNSNMTISDVVLLAKKIAVGIFLTAAPFALIAGGIWLALKFLH
jgi:hypothetical protein